MIKTNNKLLKKNTLVKCKRWFSSSCGNTYHSVQIVDFTTSNTYGYEPFSYGYDNQCLQTAVDMLKELGIKVSYSEMCQSDMYCIEDVKRKRDL